MVEVSEDVNNLVYIAAVISPLSVPAEDGVRASASVLFLVESICKSSTMPRMLNERLSLDAWR